MGNMKNRLERLEANAPSPAEERITEIHRVIVGRTHTDGSPLVIVRRLEP